MSLTKTPNIRATHFQGPVNQGSGSVQSITEAYTVTNEDNGVALILDGGTGVAITLPAPKRGLRLKFIVGAAFTTDYVITATGAIMEGCILEAGAVQDVAGATTLTLEDGTENVGDYIDMISDGTNWYVTGNFLTALSITPA